ncbi:DUF4386 domain-containing protein [Raineyella sp. W15-4]|uniref:DUF4386 domain-containing protein n=1 Tax=Raineyella sp. W15-4 TaxID=3081651 RepID=UPI002954A4E7|nr:DUF4386 domain-containing protein [Raineyella sp. W15-4]WOQ18453.1 DUF4386 domain-containing protein [Raineyella sp. W15-4]
MSHPRRLALTAGLLYLVTVVTSIPALAVKAPILKDPATLASPAVRNALLGATLLEVVLASSCVGTAVVLYPIARRQSETAALGFVMSRLAEAGLVLLGVAAMVSLTTIVPGTTIVPDGPTAAPATVSSATSALVAIHDWAFLLGPGLIPAVNALLLGSVMYRSGLVPRIIPAVGFIGAPLLMASAIATLFGLVEQVSAVAGLAALPVALWEISLGLWLTVKGFRPEAVARLIRSAAEPARAIE